MDEDRLGRKAEAAQLKYATLAGNLNVAGT